jgi:hypothetical protein
MIYHLELTQSQMLIETPLTAYLLAPTTDQKSKFRKINETAKETTNQQMRKLQMNTE